jgi:predicted HicB family RNase H-like nuclease
MQRTVRYPKIVEWSEKDGCYVGTCLGLIYGGVQGDDETEVFRELCQAVAGAAEVCEADGEPLLHGTANEEYTGRFVLKVDKELHREVATHALQAGESLNDYCQKVLRRAIEQGVTIE